LTSIVFTFFAILLIMQSSQAQSDSSLKEKLTQYTWKKRVLLVVAPSSTDEQLRKQKEILNKQASGTQDRDMEVIYLPLNTISASDKDYLADTYNIRQSEFYSILLGKDGGEKLRSQTPMETDQLFSTIDAMPMRKQETKNK
jgi:hypothetical protein